MRCRRPQLVRVGRHLPQPDDQRVAVAQRARCRRRAAARENGARCPAPAVPSRSTIRALNASAVSRGTSACTTPKQRVASGRNVGRSIMCRRVSVDDGFQTDRRRCGREQRISGAEELVDAALVHREQQLVLAREIEVDGAFGEAGLVGDLRDVGDALGRALRAAARPRRGLRDAAPACLPSERRAAGSPLFLLLTTPN